MTYLPNCISGVMVSVVASSAVYQGFERQLGHIKEYEIGICCFSAKHAALRKKSKDCNDLSYNMNDKWRFRPTEFVFRVIPLVTL
jgi:hypothetical protein